MPTTVLDDPLRLACVFSDGSRAAFDLTGLPDPGLVRDLATGLVELIHPHGSVDTAGTVDQYVRGLHRMVRTLSDQGFTGGVGDLRRGQLAQFWMAGPNWLEALTRYLVEGYARSGGRLGEGAGAGRRAALQHSAQSAPVAALFRGRMAAADHGLPTAGRRLLRGTSARAGVRRRRAASGHGCVDSSELLLAVVDTRPAWQQRSC